MLISLIKNYIKKNLPNTYNYIVKIRDGNPFLKKIKGSINLSLNKKIHGTRIVDNEKGIFINLTKSNYLSFNLRFFPNLAKKHYDETAQKINHQLPKNVILFNPKRRILTQEVYILKNAMTG